MLILILLLCSCIITLIFVTVRVDNALNLISYSDRKRLIKEEKIFKNN